MATPGVAVDNGAVIPAIFSPLMLQQPYIYTYIYAPIAHSAVILSMHDKVMSYRLTDNLRKFCLRTLLLKHVRNLNYLHAYYVKFLLFIK